MDTNILAQNADFFSDSNSGWIDDSSDGQLAIDVYETADEIVVKSTIAGVDPENLDISVNHDMLTIRGRRDESREVDEPNYLFRECYWGSFSRSIILPVDVDDKKIDASIKNGVLTIILPKINNRQQKIEVKISD